VAERADKALPPATAREVMGSYKHPHAFRPIDLEIIDRVYEVAWETIKAQNLFRDTAEDEEQKQRLRRMLFIFAQPGKVDFDQLCDQVLTNLTEAWALPPRKRRPSRKVGVA
jgi:hypothetical protein